MHAITDRVEFYLFEACGRRICANLNPRGGTAQKSSVLHKGHDPSVSFNTETVLSLVFDVRRSSVFSMSS